MRKDKAAGEVALVELPQQSSLGVRTRAKTLALQRLQSSAAVTPPHDSCYLELRSRRLAKPLPPQNSRKPRQSRNVGVLNKIEAEEACFGDNTMDCGARERGMRESTPCSLIGVKNATISSPGSTTKQSCSNSTDRRRTRSRSAVNVENPAELEELFAQEEQSQQHHFLEKYNYDIVNDLPLPGRYEWVAVRP